MESNDNGALSEVQIRKPHSATGTQLAEERIRKIQKKWWPLGKSGASG